MSLAFRTQCHHSASRFRTEAVPHRLPPFCSLLPWVVKETANRRAKLSAWLDEIRFHRHPRPSSHKSLDGPAKAQVLTEHVLLQELPALGMASKALVILLDHARFQQARVLHTPCQGIVPNPAGFQRKLGGACQGADLCLRFVREISNLNTLETHPVLMHPRYSDQPSVHLLNKAHWRRLEAGKNAFQK